MADPSKSVLSCAIITATSTVAGSVLPTSAGGKGSLPTPRLLIGAALTFTALGMLVDPAPGLAVPLAVVIASSALYYYGFPVASNYFSGTKLPVGIPTN